MEANGNNTSRELPNHPDEKELAQQSSAKAASAARVRTRYAEAIEKLAHGEFDSQMRVARDVMQENSDVLGKLAE